ncbi:MAG: aldehyde dehydrogenase family protein [Christensenellales bacterium]|jgi:acyl-CoA reductase-like NAD-dependent aldehyde dehydrogenase
MKMIIGGKKVDSADKKTQEVLNPATHTVIDTVPMATKEDVDQAVENAQNGFKLWSATPLHQRIETIYAYIQILKDNRKELITLGMQEIGKTRAMADSEFDITIQLIKNFCESARSLGGETLAINNQFYAENDLAITVREPWGVVLCILPFNWPIELFSQKVIPALLMGNAVIIKPSSETPLSNIYMTELLLKCGVAPDALQIVTGSGSKVGKWIISNGKINMISLTGSTEVGIQTAKDGADHLHRVSLELGGNDALIVLDDADIDYAVSESLSGRLPNAGQICCGSKRFFVQNSIKEEFTTKLLEELKKVKVGDPLDEDTTYGPIISERAAIDVEQQIQKTIAQGARLMFGGKRFDKTFIEPTLLVDVTPDMDIAKDMEIFGPVWPVIGFDTIEEAIEMANSTKYGLSGGVITKDVKKAMTVARAMQSGCCVINGTGMYRAADQPFGGYKMSGLGREGGKFTLEEMSQLKTIVFKKLY